MSKLAKLGILGVLAAGITFLSVYTVPEGHITVVNRFSKAVRMENPGIQFKIPVLETTVPFEVRERKNVEELDASTKNRLPVTAKVSMNWTVKKTAAMDLYIQYGGLEQFEDRVLDPRMKSAAKAAIAHFSADIIIKDRQLVVAEILKEIRSVTEMLPIDINQAQLENIQLPPAYLASILAKEQAKEDAVREEHALEKQKLVAQQLVQTADAERDAVKSRADGNAYAVRVSAEAEAFRILTEYTGRSDGVALLSAQITPGYIAYLRAQGWNGVYPTHMLANNMDILLGMGK